MPHDQDPIYLNLYNFDLPQHEDSPYIVTSPRSLKACHQIGVKPCELLYKSLGEYEQELPHLPLRDVVYKYERGERARQEKLSLCRELRLRHVHSSLRRAGGGGGRCGTHRCTSSGVRPDLLPPAAPVRVMSSSCGAASPRSAALSRTKSVSWAGLDQSGEYFTDLPGDDGDMSSNGDVHEDIWSSEEEDSDVGEREDTGPAGEEDRESVMEEVLDDEDRGGEEEERSVEEWVRGAERRSSAIPSEEVDRHGRDAAAEGESDSGEDVPREGTPQEDHGRNGDDFEDNGQDVPARTRYREDTHVSDSEDGSSSEDNAHAREDGGGEQAGDSDWYPMEDSRGADLRLDLLPRSSPGLSVSAVSAPRTGQRGQPKSTTVAFSDRTTKRTPSPHAQKARATSATTRSRAFRSYTPHSAEDKRRWRRRHDATAASSGDDGSGADLRVRPSDRRLLELMTRRQEQDRLQESHALQERERWRQEWLQELRRRAESEERRESAVLARRRAEAGESLRRREELEQRHSRSLENLSALIDARDRRTELELSAQRARKNEYLAERQRREQQQQLLTSQQREQLEAEDREQRWQQRERLQRRMEETERRRTDRETARTQHVSSLNASWLALSEERIQRLDEVAERRSRHVWEELSRRLQSAAENQRRLERGRRARAAVSSATEEERRRQARAARHQQQQLSAGRGREAAARLQRDQLRAEQTARQLAESRQLALSRENLSRQSRHRQAYQHIRDLEEQVLDEARFKLKLDEARVEQFVQRRERAVSASRHLAHVAANLRQAVRSGERSVTFDRMAARAELESRVLYGPAAPSCDRLYRPRDHSHII